MNERVVIQAYGRGDIIRQGQFAALTVLRHGFSGQILIYTDQEQSLKNFFQGIPQVRLRAILPEEIKKWRGQIDFVHRVKLEILKDAAQNWTGPLLYLDGDVVLRQSVSQVFSRLSEKTPVMHLQESQLKNSKDILTRKIAKFCRKNKIVVAGNSFFVPPETWMWNAGVIGLHFSHFSRLDQMLEFTDFAYRLYPKHVIEQLAVSYYLESTGQVQPSDDLILHYWQSKEIWQTKIDLFLSGCGTAAKALELLPRFDWSEPTPVPKKKKWWKLF